MCPVSEGWGEVIVTVAVPSGQNEGSKDMEKKELGPSEGLVKVLNDRQVMVKWHREDSPENDNIVFVEFGFSSPKGCDVRETITVDLDECRDGADGQADFDMLVCRGVRDIYNNFDISEYAYKWLSDGKDGRIAGHGVEGAPNRMIDVYNDAVDIENRWSYIANECDIYYSGHNYYDGEEV